MAKKSKLPIAKDNSTLSMPDKYIPTKEDKARERRYKAEDALRTCKEYEKLKSDKELMADVKQLAKEEMDKLAKVAGK